MLKKITITNSKGEQVSVEKYDYVDSIEGFVNGYAIVSLNGKLGFINEQGEEICPIKYEMLWPFRETCTPKGERVLNAAIARLNGKYGLIDRNGIEITPFKYSRIDHFDGDQRAYAEAGKNFCCYLHEDGKETPIHVFVSD